MLDTNTIDTVSQIIKNTRKEQGLTQEDLAGLSGTGRRFISELECGKQRVQLDKVLLVLNALGLSLTISNKWQNR